MAVTIRADIYDPIVKASQQYGIDRELIAAIIKVESNFEVYATNPISGAAGLMQIHPIHASWLDWSKIYDPAYNIEAGTAIYHDRLVNPAWGCDGDINCALAGYVGYGDDLVAAAGYIASVMGWYAYYKAEGLVSSIISQVSQWGNVLPYLLLGGAAITLFLLKGRRL